jgi:hypothetical protein
MKIPPLPFTVTDWSAVAPTVHPGETGEAIWRTFTIGDLRVRQVEYTPAIWRITGAIWGMSSTYSKANSIPNFATGEHSSCCRG